MLTLCLSEVLIKNESKIFGSLPIKNWCMKYIDTYKHTLLGFPKRKAFQNLLQYKVKIIQPTHKTVSQSSVEKLPVVTMN